MNKLFIPGPVELSRKVLEAQTKQPISHRSAEFHGIWRNCHDGLQRVFRTNGKVVILTASGTGAIDAGLLVLFWTPTVYWYLKTESLDEDSPLTPRFMQGNAR